MPTALLTPKAFNDGENSDPSTGAGTSNRGSADCTRSDLDLEERSAVVRSHRKPQMDRLTSGLTLFVKKGSGFTRKLQAHTKLLPYIECAYSYNSSSQVLLCDRLLLIAGRIGITAIVPFIANHWNVQLSWSVRENARCLVTELDGLLGTLVDEDIRVGLRLDVPSLLAHEPSAGWIERLNPRASRTPLARSSAVELLHIPDVLSAFRMSGMLSLMQSIVTKHTTITMKYNVNMPVDELQKPTTGHGGHQPLYPHDEVFPKGWLGETLTKALPCDILIQHDFGIKVRDGCTSYSDVLRPANDLPKVMAIICWSPFGKNFNGMTSFSFMGPYNP